MGWIRCIGCEKLQRDFVARTFALIAPVLSVFNKFLAVTKRSQMRRNTMKRTKTLGQGAMGRIGCIRCEKSRHDFTARTFALIALVHPVLHQVSCSYETITNAPIHYETHQNKSLGSNGVDQVRQLQKNPTRHSGTHFFTSCTSFIQIAPSFVK